MGLFSSCCSSKGSHISNPIGDDLGKLAGEGFAVEEANSKARDRGGDY